MILNDFTVPKSKFSNEQLDAVLAEVCGLVIKGQQDDPDFNGMVGAAVIDPKGRVVTGVNYLYGNARVHAERAAIDNYEQAYGELPKGCIVVTTLSPCSEKMDKRCGESCTDLLNEKHVKLAYCGYKDPTQDDRSKFTVIITANSKIEALCKKFADTFLDKVCENFADGKVKGKSRPGRVKKAGASCNGSVSDLRHKAKNASGERAKMYHWCANMKSGKKKTNEETSKQILSYIKKVHPKGEFTIDQSITDHPEWELTNVPLSRLHIESDDVSPYGQINWIDYDHVDNITAQDIKAKPIVVDSNGWIIDGNHRAVAARDKGMTHIPAYVPVEQEEDDEQETYAQHMARINKERELAESKSLPLDIQKLLDNLTPADVGVEEVGNYRVHFEGFTDDCKSSGDYKRNPEAVYQQVFNDFISREGGKKPIASGMTGDEEYPILYSVFKVPQSRTVDTPDRAYQIAYKKKQPWPKGSREEQLIRSDWQLSDLYDKYILHNELDEVITNPNVKAKGANTANLVNKGEPIPAGKEQKLLGTKVGKLGAYEVYKWDKGNDSAYSIFNPQTRVSQLTVSGHNKAHAFEIFGVYAGPEAPVKAADLYAWLVRNQGLTLLSDKQQSPGGHRVWQDLEQRYGRSVNVYAYNMRTNEPINTGADDPESTHGHRGDVAQNVRLVAAPK